jgi:hypothetical protein
MYRCFSILHVVKHYVWCRAENVLRLFYEDILGSVYPMDTSISNPPVTDEKRFNELSAKVGIHLKELDLLSENI